MLMYPLASSSRFLRVLIALVIFSGLLLVSLQTSRGADAVSTALKKVNSALPGRTEVTIVAPTVAGENTTWLTTSFPDWTSVLYDVNSDEGPLKVPGNKAHEVMAYLTYIIDNYDKLSPVTIFHHAQRYQWHTDDPAYDSVRQLRRLRIPHVKKTGYVNLRCDWNPGCPVSYPVYDKNGVPDDGPMTLHYPEIFEFIFNKTAPKEAGQPCCAEFALADWKIRERPRKLYIHARRWAIETWMMDGLSGRMMEYIWQIMFGMEAIHCPDTKQCYCQTYGLCDLECPTPGKCNGMWIDPLDKGYFYQLPEGWPDKDWDGNWQNASAL